MADLSKFGVRLDGQALGILQPKQQHKFRVLFLGLGGDGEDTRVMTGSVTTITRPVLTVPEVQLHAYNSIGYIQGKSEWSPVEITLRDDIANGVVSAIGKQIQRQMNHFEQLTPAAGLDYKFDCEMHSLDGGSGEELEKWELNGCWISNYGTPQGDYSTGEANLTSITLRYDVATQLAGANDLGGFTQNGNPFPDPTFTPSGVTFG